MSLLYPSFLWLLLPLILFILRFRPRSLRVVIHLLIMALLLIALARPQLPKGVQETAIDAQEILIGLDLSYSMRAQDLEPDRYHYAVAVIEALLKRRPHDNIMLIAFTTNPLLLSPPTTDHTLVSTALKALKLENILTKGTSLKRLFEKIASLPKVHREVVLLTDGGEERDLAPLTDAIDKSDMHLNILALGTPQGTTIPKPDGSLLKDKEGNLVISRINPLLKRVADAAGGVYLTPSTTPEASADAIIAHFEERTGTTERVTKKRYGYTELYQIPLLLAAVLFFMLHTRASRYLVLLFALLGIPLQAGLFDAYMLDRAYSRYQAHEYNATRSLLLKIENPSLQQRFALANTYYRLHRYKEAITLYKSIRSTSPRIKQKLYYNIANAYVMLKTYDKAKIYYTKALQLGDDADAEANLALVAQLQSRQASDLGIAHPQSQSSQNSRGKMASAKEEKAKQQEDQPSSGSGAGGQMRQKSTRKEHKKLWLEYENDTAPQPLSSKVYELINKGYIREEQPW